MEPRISIITLGVTDLEKSYRFYHEGLGFPTSGTPDSGILSSFKPVACVWPFTLWTSWQKIFRQIYHAREQLFQVLRLPTTRAKKKMLMQSSDWRKKPVE